ncbi:hypothetical protein L0337_31165 [candidate division KSB1 bacterium]|nr:hypothetical protein [candidate division KSB1 bacterium]
MRARKAKKRISYRHSEDSMILRKLPYFKTLTYHLIFLIIGCGNKVDHTWKSIDITVERGVISPEGHFFSEVLKRNPHVPGKENKLATKIIYSTQSPFPVKIISAQWKIIDTYTDSSLQWGYQLALTNDYLKDSLYVGIRRIVIELLDKDDFSVKEYSQSYDNEPLGIIKRSYPLQMNEAKRVKACKMDVQCAIKDRY